MRRGGAETVPVHVAAACLVALNAFTFDEAQAGLYRCIDADGRGTFTDTPAQMTQCQPVTGEGRLSPALPAPSPHVAPTPPPATPVEMLPVSHLGVVEGITPVSDTRITVPITRVGHLFVIPVQLNGGRTAHLILDTGASHTILSHDVIQNLGLMPSDFQPGTVTLKTVSGVVDAQVVRIKSMKVATAEVRNTDVAVHTVPDSLPGVDGLLGLSFLRQFEVTLDTVKGELRLRPIQK